MGEPKTDLGRRIRRARKAKGWFQHDLAARVDVSPEYISHIESGRRVPSPGRALRIAEALEDDPDDYVSAAIRYRYPEAARLARRTGARRTFKVVMEWDPDDELWVTYVPTLGQLSTYGSTRDEALEMTREAVLGYLEAVEKEGLPMPPADRVDEVVDLEVEVP